MIAFIDNGVITATNVSFSQVQKRYPNTSFCVPLESQDLEESYGIVTVKEIPHPEYNEDTHSIQEGTPELIDGVWTATWDLVPHSDEELQEHTRTKSLAIRYKRDSFLEQTDWTQLPDASVNASEWATYRQALRDLPTQEGFPLNITWPTKP